MIRIDKNSNKIGILTAARTNNNGTDLQAYAMYSVFCRYFPVEIINYACEKLERSHNILPKLTFKDIVNIPYRLYLNMTHAYFRKKHFKLSGMVRHSKNLDLSDYSTVVVGSDQIWNLRVTGGDMNFYLPSKLGRFKRYSYAASLGKTELGEWENKYEISKHLNEFVDVSVRENSGVDSLNKIFVKAHKNLDPILLLNESEWKRILIPYYRRKPYVLLYMAEPNSLADSYAKEYARLHNCTIIRYCFAIEKREKDISKKAFISIGKWLGIMKGAELVVTNSYHGLSVAVALKTNFRAFGLKNRQSQTRIESLLDDIDLRSLFLCDKEEFDFDRRIDWVTVESKLNLLRMDSVEYIKQIFGE